jgi:hypothetical protein
VIIASIALSTTSSGDERRPHNADSGCARSQWMDVSWLALESPEGVWHAGGIDSSPLFYTPFELLDERIASSHANDANAECLA